MIKKGLSLKMMELMELRIKIKKSICFLLFTFSLAFSFAIAHPSLEGRAVVADDGAMSKGMFAEAVGFQPGDMIDVLNPLNGKSVEVLVLGALDPSEGLAIRLSAEAAETIGIKRKSNTLVKITKVASSSEKQTFLDDEFGGEFDDDEIADIRKLKEGH